MTRIVNVQEAKTRLSELLRQVEAGEEISIARAGHVIARLQSVEPPRRSFNAPLLPGLPRMDFSVFLDPMSDEELSEWEEGHPGDPLSEVAS